MNIFTIKNYLLVLIISFFLASCTNNQDEVTSSQNNSVIKFYFEKGRYHDLLNEANALSEDARNDPELRLIVASTYLKIGHAEQALEMLEGIKSDSYTNSEVDLLLVEALIKLSKLKKARDLLWSEEVQSVYVDNPELLVLQAQLELAENNTNIAKSYLLNVESADKVYVQAQVWLARIELLEGKRASAEKRIETLVSEGKESDEAWLLLANIKFHEQEYVDAENYYLKALRFDNSKILSQQSLQIAKNIVRTKTALGNASSGKIFYQTFLESYPKSPIYYFELAKFAYENNEMLLAEQHLLEVLKQTQNNPRVVSFLAKVFIKQNKLGDASTLLQSYTKDGSNNLELVILKAIADMGLDKYDEAIESLNSYSIDSGQSRFELTPLLAYIQLKNQSEENYIKVLSGYDIHNSDHIRSIGVTAKIFSEVGKNNEAEQFVDQLIQTYPSSNELKLLYLSIVGSAGNEAQTQKQSQSQDKLSQWLSEQPDNATLRLVSINQDIRHGSYSKAIRQFKGIAAKQLSEREKNLLSNTIKNLVLSTKGQQIDQKNVIDLLVRWQKALPNNMQLNLLLADMYITKAAYKKAAPLYEIILSKYPNDYVILNNLAWCYFKLEDPRALVTAERAYASNPSDGSVNDTLGWILVNSGQVEEGLQFIQEALATLPENLDVQEHFNKAKELLKGG